MAEPLRHEHVDIAAGAQSALRSGHSESSKARLLREVSMASRKLLLLPGDGIGPEAMAEVKKLIAAMNEKLGSGFETEEGLVGGSAYDAHGKAISDADMAKALAVDAVLFGAVGGPKWDKVPYEVRPEAGLLRLRKDMELFANLRPAICYPALADSSSLKKDVVEGLDILIVRELTGGVYFGEPKEIIDLGNGQKRGIDTQVYDTFEIERISGVAFELARTRQNKVCSMEKRNVMKSGVLWNDVVTATHKAKYSDVELSHMLADAGGMQLVRWPKQFDVIVTDNLFGDMLSDIAAMLTGSIGMLPSASLGAPDPKTGKRKALYEPVHGSAPDIAGTGKANPIAMIASFAMCLRYSFNMVAEADRLEAAIAAVLDDGLRTGDIMSAGMTEVGTTAMGDAIVNKFLT
jgi:3-isopropylmalate dehydrogenase